LIEHDNSPFAQGSAAAAIRNDVSDTGKPATGKFPGRSNPCQK
jgi:hypothetical protein